MRTRVFSGVWRRRIARPVAWALTGVLAVTLLQVPQAAAQALAERGAPPVPGRGAPARGKPGAVKPRGADPTRAAALTASPRVTWPVAADGELSVSAIEVRAAQALTRIGGLPVAASALASQDDRPAVLATPTRVRVRVYGRSTSLRAGVTGPVLALRRADGVLRSGTVRLTVGYRDFEAAYGGDFGARLRVVRLPACAVTTPEQAPCRRSSPVPTVNDPTTQTLTVRVDTTAADAGTVLAMAAEDSSSQGTYAATKLSPSASWDVSLNSGAFTWSYPVRTPPTPGGLGPQIAMSYSSQAVDGRTAATNNQGSWVGEGLSYEPGYIERRYKPCADDGHTGVGDQCWAHYNASIMLSGRSGDLVKVNENTWKLSSDDGSKIERLAGAVNGDNDGEHWKLTTTDGTQYFFGLNRLPGWTGASGQEETDSTWTVPVYGDDANEPCHKATFADAYCDQAWRWNLDYVKDPRGNVISYFYERETNHYARGARFDVDGDGYHRGGYLRRIDYGERDTQVYATNAPARVHFAVAERCIPGGDIDCDPGDLNEDTAAAWPDVPRDLDCPAGTRCKTSQASPTFWTRKRLTRISTEIRSATGWLPVESWSLTHVFTNNGDASRTLWLSRISHAGHWGGTTVTMPPVDLVGMQMPNRILVPGEHISPLIRFRLKTIYTDTNGQIDINYAPADCAADTVPTPGRSTRRCYPVRWNPLGTEDPITDWFHKYVVEEVIETDRTGGNPDMVTRYQYTGPAAWRKTQPDGISKAEDLTWSDWRGYETVTVRTGDGQAMPTRVAHTFLRGMDGDADPDGGTRTVKIDDSTGGSHVDRDEWAGHELETATYDGSAIVSKTVNTPWLHHTYTQTEDWGTRRSSLVRTRTTRTLTALKPDGQGNPRWRETRTTTDHDTTWGRVTQVDESGDIATVTDDRCTRTSYVDSLAKHLYVHPSRVETVAVRCAVTNPNRATQLLSDSRTSYDLLAYGSAPVTGIATRQEEMKSHDGSTAEYVRVSETTGLDALRRPTGVRDALGYVTTMAYGETHGLSTQTTVTNPLGHVTTTDVDPAFGVPTTIVDPNGKRTDLTYDGLGRLANVWLPNRSRNAGQTPNLKYTYLIRPNKPVVVKTEKIKNDGSYRPAYGIFDAMLRPRQGQSEGPDGGWLLTDTFHTGTGQQEKTNAAYLALGTPGDAPIVVPEGSANGQTSYLYDGAGRVTAEIFSVAGDERWRTTTRYEGDRKHVDPPAGGVPTTAVTDAAGNVTELHEYNGDSPTGAADVSRYTYTASGALATVTDAAGNVWRYTYDQRNQKIKAEDPDAGTSTYGYDDLGHLTSATDGRRGITLLHVYDKLGRRTQSWQDLATDVKLSESSYDGLAKGQLHWSARYVNGKGYGVVVSNLDAFYRPGKTSFVIPSDAGAELARTYDFTTVYNLDDTVQSVGAPAAGGLPAEALVTSYDALLRPVTLAGASTYVTASTYSDIGQLLQMQMDTGAGGKKAWQTWAFERGTGRLQSARLDRQGAPAVDMDIRYRYDDAGNVLSMADVPAGGQRDIQCFNYDHRRRLTRAWTTGSAATDPCSGGPAGSGIGGPAPYHQEWTFDAVGNRRTETLHGIAGAADTERTYHYPDAGEAQPHGLTRVDETGPGGARTYSYRFDAAGNTTCRPADTATNTCPSGQGSQTLTWDPEGHLATVAGTGQPTSFVYDASGARLLRKEPNATTVYLPGMELRLDHNTRQVSGTRFYGFAGRTVAVRSATGVQFQAADHHGTASCSIDAVTGAITWRRTTPYGGPRGAPPAAWPDQKGFVGGTQDPTSGLTHLGAREYDPSIGRFVSADPVIDHFDPQQIHGYAYAHNSPVTSSDPTGLKDCADDDCTEYAVPKPGGGRIIRKPKTTPGKPGGGGGPGGGGPGGGGECPPAIFWGTMCKDGGIDQAIADEVSGCEVMFQTRDLCRSAWMATNFHDWVKGQEYVTYIELALTICGFVPAYGSACDGLDAALAFAGNDKAGAATSGLAAVPGLDGAGTVRVVQLARRYLDFKRWSECLRHSFAGDTLILMADGSTKAIKDVQVGDEVLATEPETGRTRPAKVITLHRNDDTELTDLRLRQQAGEAGAVLNTTRHHPVWDTTTKAWVDAGDLVPGTSAVRRPDGRSVRVSSVRNHTGGRRMYDLTVADVHTYYVLAGRTPLLVHNCNISKNKAFGDAYRDKVAEFLRSQGRTTITDAEDWQRLTFETPHGRRTLDIAVYDERGSLMGYVETKTGSSPYHGTDQEKADAWIRETYGVNVDVVFGPSGCTCK